MPSAWGSVLGGLVQGVGAGVGQAAQMSMQEYLEQRKSELAARREERLQSIMSENRITEKGVDAGYREKEMKLGSDLQMKMAEFNQEFEREKLNIMQDNTLERDEQQAKLQERRDELLHKYGLENLAVQGQTARAVAGIGASAANRGMDIKEADEARRQELIDKKDALQQRLDTLKEGTPEWKAVQRQISKIVSEDLPLAMGQLPKGRGDVEDPAVARNVEAARKTVADLGMNPNARKPGTPEYSLYQDALKTLDAGITRKNPAAASPGMQSPKRTPDGKLVWPWEPSYSAL